MNKYLFVGLMLVGLVFVGCSSRQSLFDQKSRDKSGQRITRLANLYCLYQQRHGQRSPKDEAALRAYILELPPEVQTRFNVESEKIDEVFISDRDSKPFKVRWGAKMTAMGPLVPLVFEQAGVDGQYQVAFSSSVTKDVDQSTYDDLWEFNFKKAAKELGPGRK